MNIFTNKHLGCEAVTVFNNLNIDKYFNIYISKSEQINFTGSIRDDIINKCSELIKYLETKNCNLRLLLHNNSPYSTDGLLSAEFVIVLGIGSKFVSKEVYSEITSAKCFGKYVAYYDASTSSFIDIEEHKIYDPYDWKVKYGLLSLGNSFSSIKEFVCYCYNKSISCSEVPLVSEGGFKEAPEPLITEGDLKMTSNGEITINANWKEKLYSFHLKNLLRF